MSAPAATLEFMPIADALRRDIIAFYAARGEELAGASGLNTLETNSGFVERRGLPLLDIYRQASGRTSLAGLDVLDLGSGFGALALLLAAHGTRVHAVDPNDERGPVGEAVARRFGLEVEFRRGRAQELEAPDASFDLVVSNNAHCYIVDRDERAAAAREMLRVLRPGGWLLMRNPNGLFPIDQFTRLPLLPLLGPGAARAAARVLRRHRSDVRLLSPRAARRELRRAGFADVRDVNPEPPPRPLRPFVRYQHLVGRRPAGGQPLAASTG